MKEVKEASDKEVEAEVIYLNDDENSYEDNVIYIRKENQV